MLKDRIVDAIVASWYTPNSTLTKFLKPLSKIYGKAIELKKQYFQRKPKHFPVPVIVIGNLTVGGTGKTPLIMYLYESLKEQGFIPGIVSRGYLGQLSTEFPVLVKEHHSPEEVGDEPFMVYKRTRAPVMICRDRVKAVNALLTIAPTTNVILSDDGLQHDAMARNIEIVVVDGARRFGNAELLPAGPLREPVSRLRTVDFVVISQGKVSENEYRMDFKGETLYAVGNPAETLPLETFEDLTIHAVAGIGYPEKFFKTLREKKLKVIPHAFSDHYVYHKKDFQFKPSATIIMTEKDAVKCHALGLSDAWFLPINAELDPEFVNAIVRKLQDG